MVDISRIQAFRDYISDNEERFYRENPGKLFLLEFNSEFPYGMDKDGNLMIKESFFDSKEELNEAIKKYDSFKGMIGGGPRYEFGSIPQKTHKFEKGVTEKMIFREGKWIKFTDFYDHISENEERYCKEYSNGIIFLELDDDNKIKETIIEKESQLNELYEPHKKRGKLNQKYKVIRVPSDMNEYKKGFLLNLLYKNNSKCDVRSESIPGTERVVETRVTLEFRLDEHVDKCIHDNETELVAISGISSTHIPGKEPRYEEWAECPDCGYKVQRKPTDEDIEKRNKRLDELVF